MNRDYNNCWKLEYIRFVYSGVACMIGIQVEIITTTSHSSPIRTDFLTKTIDFRRVLTSCWLECSKNSRSQELISQQSGRFNSIILRKRSLLTSGKKVIDQTIEGQELC